MTDGADYLPIQVFVVAGSSPSILVHLFPCFLISFRVIFLCLTLTPSLKTHRGAVRWYKNLLDSPLLHKVIRGIFKVLKQGSSVNETYLFDYKVPNYFVFSLLSSTVYITCSTVAVFWLEFLVEETNSCSATDPALHCFSNDPGSFGRSIRCLNNGQTIPSNVTSVLCYKFAIDFGEGFKTAGGILTSSVAIFAMVTFSLLALSGGRSGSKKRKLITVSFQTTCFVFASFLYAALLSAATEYGIYKRIAISTEVSVLYGAAIIALLLPWWKFRKENFDSKIIHTDDNYSSNYVHLSNHADK